MSYTAAGTVLWRHAGRLNLTVVVKAKLMLEEGQARLAPAEEIITAERVAPGLRSLSHDVDIAPYKPRAEVIFTGHAWSRTPVPHLMVRLGVQGDGSSFDKPLQIVGDRTAPNAPAAQFQKLPLVWERAWADASANPVGIDAAQRRVANILDPSDMRAPAGYAPLARSWPARTRFVGRGDTRKLEGTRPEMPNDLSWGYFLSAPQDQQLERLRGNELITLENLIEGRPRLRSQLPNILATAKLFGPSSPGQGTPVDLKIDTLVIDGDRQCAYVIWRGTTPFANEAAASQSRVVSSVDLGTPEMITSVGKPLRQNMQAAGSQAPDDPRASKFQGSPVTVRVPPANDPGAWGGSQSPYAAFKPEPKTMPVGHQFTNLPKLTTEPADDDAPESTAGSTMALDPEAAMKMLAEARAALPFQHGAPPLGRPLPPPPAPPPPAPPPPAPMQAAMRKADIVVRPHADSSIGDDEDTSGSTMAITPEAAAQLLARKPGGAPAAPMPNSGPMSRGGVKSAPPNLPLPPPPPPLPPSLGPHQAMPPGFPSRQGTMEIDPAPDSEEGGGTMVLEPPPHVRRR